MSVVHLLPLAIAAAFGAMSDPPHPQVVVPAQADTGDTISDLEETDWLLTSIRGADADLKIGSSLSFEKDGSTFGNGGCNRFRGSAEIDGDALKFRDLASTRMACEEPNSAQEAAFHETLAETVAFRIEGGDLLLLDSKEEVLARLSPMK